MVKSIAIYIEGGGSSEATRFPFRQGMSQFLRPVVEAVRKKGIAWRLVVCGGRREAYDKYCDALRHEPEVFNILLVDSEEVIPYDCVSPWEYLKKFSGDYWETPRGVRDEQCHLMAVNMEAWLLADVERFAQHFGGGFDRRAIPDAAVIEHCNKDEIRMAINHATQKTVFGGYGKIRDGAKLLGKVDSAIVRKHCKWCRRLFETLGKIIGTEV